MTVLATFGQILYCFDIILYYFDIGSKRGVDAANTWRQSAESEMDGGAALYRLISPTVLWGISLCIVSSAHILGAMFSIVVANWLGCRRVGYHSSYLAHLLSNYYHLFAGDHGLLLYVLSWFCHATHFHY